VNYWWPKTFINQIWRRFVSILIMVQIIVAGVFLIESGNLVGHRMGVATASLIGLIDIIYEHGDPEMINQVYELLNTRVEVKFLPETVMTNLATPLPYPAMHAFTKAFNRLMAGKAIVNYQSSPVPMIWLQKTQAPLYTLGVPFLAHKFTLVLAFSSLLIISLAALLMGWWITKRISQPLLKLAEDALQMVERKTDCISTSPGGLSEITVLANALNTMRADIYRMIKEREVFLAEISHDLRTPLSRMRVAIEMLDQDTSGLVDGIKEDIEEMTSILEQTIILAHINLEENKPWIEGDINRLLSEIHQKYRRAGITLTLDLVAMPKIKFNPLAITRLLYNLIDNGLKHGAGSVQLISRIEDDRPTVFVVNAANASDEHITVPSNGIGLLIVERIARMHDIQLSTRKRSNGEHWVSVGFNTDFKASKSAAPASTPSAR